MDYYLTWPGRANPMNLVAVNIKAEVRKALKGKPTKVSIESLFHMIAPTYLAVLKAEAVQPDVEELERMFRLEDPRGR
jgi:hypothetical protein